MDRNNIVGLLLIALVLIGFSWWTQPSKEEKRQAQIQDSIAYVQRQKAEKYKAQQEMERRKAAQARIMEDTTALFHAALKGQQQKIVLRNNHVELTLNSKGAYVEKAVIKGYKSRELQIRSHNSKDDSKEPNEVTLFDEKEQKLNFVLSAKETNIYHKQLKCFQVLISPQGNANCIDAAYLMNKATVTEP